MTPRAVYLRFGNMREKPSRVALTLTGFCEATMIVCIGTWRVVSRGVIRVLEVVTPYVICVVQILLYIILFIVAGL